MRPPLAQAFDQFGDRRRLIPRGFKGCMQVEGWHRNTVGILTREGADCSRSQAAGSGA